MASLVNGDLLALKLEHFLLLNHYYIVHTKLF